MGEKAPPASRAGTPRMSLTAERGQLDAADVPMPAGSGAIARRLDRLPLTALHVAVLVLCTLGLAADIGEVALSNTFSALFLAPPYSATHGDVVAAAGRGVYRRGGWRAGVRLAGRPGGAARGAPGGARRPG